MEMNLLQQNKMKVNSRKIFAQNHTFKNKKRWKVMLNGSDTWNQNAKRHKWCSRNTAVTLNTCFIGRVWVCMFTDYDHSFSSFWL